MQVKVVYKSEQKIEPELDTILREAMSKAGCRCYGSGFDLTNGERDIVFDSPE